MKNINWAKWSFSAVILLFLVGCNSQYGAIEADIKEDHRNDGVDFSLSGDFSGNAILHFTAVDGNNAPMDLIRISLHAIEGIDSEDLNPEKLIFRVSGRDKFILDGSVIENIAYNFNVGKPIPAWRLIVEESRKPDGSRLMYSYNLLEATGEALKKAQLLIPDTIR